MTRLGDKALTRFALLTLEDATTRAHAGPIERSWAIKLALAFLYDRHGGERRWYDQFWATMDKGALSRHSAYLSDVHRHNAMHASMEAIYRAAGVQRTVEMMSARNSARKTTLEKDNPVTFPLAQRE